MYLPLLEQYLDSYLRPHQPDRNISKKYATEHPHHQVVAKNIKSNFVFRNNNHGDASSIPIG